MIDDDSKFVSLASVSGSDSESGTDHGSGTGEQLPDESKQEITDNTSGISKESQTDNLSISEETTMTQDEIKDKLEELEKGFQDKINQLEQDFQKRVPPVATIDAFFRTSPPDLWLECNGQWVARKDYPELFNVIGGFTDVNATSFRLPDLRGNFIRGWSSNIRGHRSQDNRRLGAWEDCLVQYHQHTGRTSWGGGHNHSIGFDPSSADGNRWKYKSFPNYNTRNENRGERTGWGGDHNHALEISWGDAGCGQETRPMNCAFMYCIKAKDK